MSGFTGIWDQLVDAVCRPPRDSDYMDRDLIGGRKAAFRIGRDRYYRQDLELENSRGEKLVCSHYRPCIVPSRDGRLPAVIYCHCNSGSRRDAEEIVYYFLTQHVTVFALDFAGSGKSEGSWVTLGAREVDDVEAAVRYLRDEGAALTIGLWGRSMGSVAAMLYARRDPSIAGLVLDSAFSRLRDLMLELGTSEASLGIPKALTRVALAILKRSVRRRAGFSIDEVAPLDLVHEIFCPALFGHGEGDTFVSPEHSRRLAKDYGGEARLELFDGDHNSPRPEAFYDEATMFMLRALRVDELLGECEVFWSEANRTSSRAVDGDEKVAERLPSQQQSQELSASAAAASPRRELNPPWSRSSVNLARENLAREESINVTGPDNSRRHPGSNWMTGWGASRPCPADGTSAASRALRSEEVDEEDEEENGASPLSLDEEEEQQLARALELSLSEQGRVSSSSGRTADGTREGSFPNEEEEEDDAQQLALAMELSLQTEREERLARQKEGNTLKTSSTKQETAAESVPQLDDDEETQRRGKAAAAQLNAQENSIQHTNDEKTAVEKLAVPRQVNEAMKILS